MGKTEEAMRPTLEWNERLHYRDRLRTARYGALAHAEGFSEVCFDLEAIGLRLYGSEANMSKYIDCLRGLSRDSIILTEMPDNYPGLFSRFDPSRVGQRRDP